MAPSPSRLAWAWRSTEHNMVQQGTEAPRGMGAPRGMEAPVRQSGLRRGMEAPLGTAMAA